MPMVNAYVTPQFNLRYMFSGLGYSPLQLLKNACAEIIPAGLNSAQGPLTPGSIEFIPATVEEGLSVDVVISVEAYYLDDRASDIEVRAKTMKKALDTIFPDVTFAVFAKLITACWSSDTYDAEFDGDMSMEEAVKRHVQRTGHQFR